MDIGASSNKPLASGPKTRVCYICGRQYGVHSYDIHLKQCKELWIAREAQKDPKERKKLPEDPALRLLNRGEADSPDGKSSRNNNSNSNSNTGNNDSTPSRSELDELNKLASEAFNTEALAQCAYCGRTFLPEKLAIHNRSCTADNPARRVNAPVHKGLPTPSVQPTEPVQRPHTTSSGRPKKVDFEPAQSAQSPALPKSASKTAVSASADGALNLKLQDGHLVGHLGGPSGRPLRASHANLNNPVDEQDTSSSITNKEEAIQVINKKIEIIEATVFGLVESLNDLKAAVQVLQR